MNPDLQKTYQKFHEQANNLAIATGPNFDTALNSFLDFCESDSLMSEISKPIRSGPNIDVQSWYRAAITTRRYPPMPSGPDSRLSASYQILSAIRDKKITLEGLAAYLFDATYREAAVVSTYNFIVRPLLEGLLKKMIPSSPSPTMFFAKPEPSYVWEPIVRPILIESSDSIIDSLAATYQDLLKQEYKATRIPNS